VISRGGVTQSLTAGSRTLTSSVLRPGCRDQAKVPMLSPATGNAGIRLEHHRYLFHTRAGYADEMRRVVDTLLKAQPQAVLFITNSGPVVQIVRGLLALERMGEVDLGGYQVSYDAASHLGSRFVDIGVVNGKGALVF